MALGPALFLTALRLPSSPANRDACLQRWQPAGGWPKRPRRHAAASAASAGGPSVATPGDPYAILGVPRGATRLELKRAYRRLARLWHPDVNQSPAAGERFQAITQAFELLTDEEQRRRYDWADQRGGSSSGNGSNSSEQPPPDVHAELRLAFREAALGTRRSMAVHVIDACTVCQGTGAAAGTVVLPCACCKGRREIVKRPDHKAGGAHLTVCCPICRGCGFSVAHPCACCSGQGLRLQPRSIAVQVPAGAEDGGTLRLAGQGGVARVGGPRGAVVLTLKVGTQAGVVRRGLDLHSRLAVPLWDALLGGTVTVGTLRGSASLDIPPGTQHGAVLSLAHAGLERQPEAASSSSSSDLGASECSSGGSGSSRSSASSRQRQARGSHHFQVVLQVPREVSSAEAQLLQRLAELQRGRQRGRRPRQA